MAAFVQGTTGTATTTTVNSASFTSKVTAGSLLVVGVGAGANGQTWSVSDSLNGAYTAFPGSYNSQNSVQLFYRANSLAGASTVTAVCSGSGTLVMSLNEFSGVPLAMVHTQASAGGASPVAATLTGVAPGALVVGYTAGNASSKDAAFSYGGNDSNDDFLEYLLGAVGGSQTQTVTGGTAGLAAASFGSSPSFAAMHGTATTGIFAVVMETRDTVRVVNRSSTEIYFTVASDGAAPANPVVTGVDSFPVAGVAGAATTVQTGGSPVTVLLTCSGTAAFSVYGGQVQAVVER